MTDEREELVGRVKEHITTAIGISGPCVGDAARAAIAECAQFYTAELAVQKDAVNYWFKEANKEHNSAIKLEAGAAAMWLALGKVYTFIYTEFKESDPTTGEAFSYEARPIISVIANALSSDAGKRVLAVVKAAEEALEETVFESDDPNDPVDAWIVPTTAPGHAKLRAALAALGGEHDGR